jgi:hypothetical protein
VVGASGIRLPRKIERRQQGREGAGEVAVGRGGVREFLLRKHVDRHGRIEQRAFAGA